MHVGDDLTVRRYLGNRTEPAILSLGHYSFAFSREPWPDIRLGEGIYEATVRQGLHHVDSSAIDSDDKSETSDMRSEFLKWVGIFLYPHIGRELFWWEYVVEEIGVIIEYGDFFLRECGCHFVDNTPPGAHGEIPEFFHSDKKAYPGSFYIWTIFVEDFHMCAYKVPKRTIQCKYLRNDLYVALDEVLIGIMNIGVIECDIQDVGPPKDIWSCDDTIVELFVFEDSDEISTAHIEEKRCLVSITSVRPTKQKGFVEEIRVFQDHPGEFRFIVTDDFRFFSNIYLIFSILQTREQKVVVFGSEYDNLGGATVRAKIGDEKLDEGLRDNRIPDTIGSIEVECFYVAKVERLRFFHTYDERSDSNSGTTGDSQEYEVGVEEEGFEHRWFGNMN